MSLKIETQINFKIYLKLNFILSYKSFWIIFMVILGIYNLLWAITDSIYSDYGVKGNLSGFIIGIFLILFPQILIYTRTKKIFYTNKKASEKTIYEFNEENYKVTGETYFIESSWINTYKILELKNWILIYQDKVIAELIPKSSFAVGQLEEFKQMIPRDKGIILKLKKNI